MPRRIWRLGVVSAVGDPGVVGVGAIHEDRGWIARRRVRRRGIVVDAVKHNRGRVGIVRILGDENASGSRRRPESVGVAGSAPGNGNEHTLTIGAVCGGRQAAVGARVA